MTCHCAGQTGTAGGRQLHLFIPVEEREAALAMYPECVEKLFWVKSVVGVRVTLAKARGAVVGELAQQAWRQKAPKALQSATFSNT